jgi:GTP-binding protein EngB required for normal cell division
VQAHHWISETAATPIVIATKIDKLSRSERATTMRELERIYHRPAIAVSAARGEGIEDIWRVVAATARGVA